LATPGRPAIIKGKEYRNNLMNKSLSQLKCILTISGINNAIATTQLKKIARIMYSYEA
jgi:hypothetical protein